MEFMSKKQTIMTASAVKKSQLGLERPISAMPMAGPMAVAILENRP